MYRQQARSNVTWRRNHVGWGKRLLRKIKTVLHIVGSPIARRQVFKIPALFDELENRCEVVCIVRDVMLPCVRRNHDHGHARTVTVSINLGRRDMIIKAPIVVPG